jgi:predicted HAD superfamily hydrolase
LKKHTQQNWLETAKQAAAAKSRISLDVFDTALLRKVAHPTDVFRLMEHRLPTLGIDLPDFAQKRIEAEQSARQETAFPEITLEQIYDQFNLVDSIRSQVMSIELEIESLISIPHPQVLSFYQWAVQSGKKISFISDIYLPAEFIKKLLHEAGYSSEGGIWVSSTEMASKSQGGLFKIYLDQVEESPFDLLHLGDNPRADSLKAKESGLSAFLIPAYSGKTLVEPLLNRTIHKLCWIRKLKPFDIESLTGYATLGPLLLGFSLWLQSKLKSTEESIWFLSREGKILQSAFQNLCPEYKQSAYILVSRRAVNFASISVLDEDALNFLSSGNTALSYFDYCQRIDLPSTEITAAAKDLGIKPEEKVHSSEQKALLRKLFQKLESPILSLAEEERKSYLNYLEKLNPTKKKKLWIVDIGWHGSIQRSLTQLLRTHSAKLNTHGLYIGTFDRCSGNESPDCRMEGYLIDKSFPLISFRDLKVSLELVESLLTSTDSSLRKMIHSPSTDELAPQFETEKVPQSQVEQLEKVQEQALSLIDDILPLLDPTQRDQGLNPQFALQPLKELLRHPYPEELSCFGSIQFSDNFGISHQTKPLIPKPQALPWWKPLKLQNTFFAAYWKIGLWRRLTFVQKLVLILLSPIQTLKVFRKE